MQGVNMLYLNLLLRKFRGKLTKNAPTYDQRKLTTFDSRQLVIIIV